MFSIDIGGSCSTSDLSWLSGRSSFAGRVYMVFYFLLLNSGQSNTSKKAKAGPSREEIHEVVVKILKEVDFNTVSVSFYFQ